MTVPDSNSFLFTDFRRRKSLPQNTVVLLAAITMTVPDSISFLFTDFRMDHAWAIADAEGLVVVAYSVLVANNTAASLMSSCAKVSGL